MLYVLVLTIEYIRNLFRLQASAEKKPKVSLPKRPQRIPPVSASPAGTITGLGKMLMVASGYGLQSLIPWSTGDPSSGIPPVPDDVESLANKRRDTVAEKIQFNKDAGGGKNRASPDGTNAGEDLRARLMSVISLKPLLKEDDSKEKPAGGGEKK